MSSVNLTRQAFRARRDRAESPISLALVLGTQDEAAEALVQAASAKERLALVEEFVAYHEGCLMSAAHIGSTALNDLINFTKTCGFILNFNLAVSKLIEISSYYENIGDIDSAVRIAEESLTYAESTSDKALCRKAYSRLGACYSRQFDFERSCICYKNALGLAVSIADPLYEFAVLSNIVTLLDAMGLTREASRLADKVCKRYPSGTREFDLLHLQNSINGFRFAAVLKDSTDMERFHALASRKMRGVIQTPEIWRAYFEANYIKRLIHQRKLVEAKRRIRRWTKRATTQANIRVSVLSLASSVECAIAMSDETWIQELKVSLNAALPLSKSYPPDYELVLGLLAQVYENNYSDAEVQLSRAYSRRLQEHVLNVRHRQFFERLSRKGRLDKEVAPILGNPAYNVAIPMSEVSEVAASEGQLSTPSVHKSDEFFLDLEGRFLRAHASSDERELRTVDYCIAENWAVAAEFGNNGDGDHCFLVGALANRIAAAMGFNANQCVLIELATRLHDIGKIGVPGASVYKRSIAEWHNSIYMREHCTVGEQLLGSSSDEVLTLASKIARSHHEWWNGFGFPDALSGEAIPIEARICAVASEYSGLLSSREPEATWSHQEAISQITTMAGVQLDPRVVQSFVGLNDLESWKDDAERASGKLKVNSLKIAKAELDACVSLI